VLCNITSMNLMQVDGVVFRYSVNLYYMISRTDLLRMDIGKYSFVSRTIRLWNRLLAEISGILPCKTNAFIKRVGKVINVVN
jgi:hypothetical protein